MGATTKILFFVNLISFIVQYLILELMLKKDMTNIVALCPTGVFNENQWYRYFTSEITHGGFSHILFNMCIFLVWGTDLEEHYGTLFYLCINLWLGLFSNLLSNLISFFQAYYLPT